MKRREFLHTAGLAALAATPAIADETATGAGERIRWKMVTAWPKNLPGPGVSANRLAALIHDMSEGRLRIRVYAAVHHQWNDKLALLGSVGWEEFSEFGKIQVGLTNTGG